MIDKTTLGTKHRCPNCGIKFYDMNRSPVTCPKCGASLDKNAEALIEEVDPIEEDPILPVNDDEILDVEGVEEILEDTPIEPSIAEDTWTEDG